MKVEIKGNLVGVYSRFMRGHLKEGDKITITKNPKGQEPSFILSSNGIQSLRSDHVLVTRAGEIIMPHVQPDSEARDEFSPRLKVTGMEVNIEFDSLAPFTRRIITNHPHYTISLADRQFIVDRKRIDSSGAVEVTTETARGVLLSGRDHVSLLDYECLDPTTPPDAKRRMIRRSIQTLTAL